MKMKQIEIINTIDCLNGIVFEPGVYWCEPHTGMARVYLDGTFGLCVILDLDSNARLIEAVQS